MKIIEQTPTTLICKRPNLIAHIAAIGVTAVGMGLLIGALIAPDKIHWLWGTIALGIGLVSLLIVRSLTINIDKQRKRVEIISRSLLLGTKEISLGFPEIREIVVDERINRTKIGNSENTAPTERFTYFLIFQLQNGMQHGLDITPAGSTAINGISTDRFEKNNRVMELGNSIASFIGVPCVDKRVATFGEMADAVENVIKQIKSQKP